MATEDDVWKAVQRLRKERRKQKKGAGEASTPPVVVVSDSASTEIPDVEADHSDSTGTEE
jgi:hypothetical protein